LEAGDDDRCDAVVVGRFDPITVRRFHAIGYEKSAALKYTTSSARHDGIARRISSAKIVNATGDELRALSRRVAALSLFEHLRAAYAAALQTPLFDGVSMRAILK
jgi:hypothetical protein